MNKCYYISSGEVFMVSFRCQQQLTSHFVVSRSVVLMWHYDVSSSAAFFSFDRSNAFEIITHKSYHKCDF